MWKEILIKNYTTVVFHEHRVNMTVNHATKLEET